MIKLGSCNLWESESTEAEKMDFTKNYETWALDWVMLNFMDSAMVFGV